MADKASPAPHLNYPGWQSEYEAALFELGREKLLQRLIAAETAIFKRLQAISQSPDDQPERQAIQNARGNLRDLKRDNLGFPD